MLSSPPSSALFANKSTRLSAAWTAGRSMCTRPLTPVSNDLVSTTWTCIICTAHDPKVPIEETVGDMAELVKAGKVRFLGLSEVSPNTLRGTQSPSHHRGLQSEYSLWTPILRPKSYQPAAVWASALCPTVRWDAVFYPSIANPDNLAQDDFRRHHPRFEGDNFAKNAALLGKLKDMASKRGCTPPQLALHGCWLKATT